MKERGMIFNSEMVRAILDGRKTQTRRVIKLFHERGMLNPVVRGRNGEISSVSCRLAPMLCPFGQPGDRIWVRETWGVVSHELDEDGRIQPWNPDRSATAIHEMPFGNGYYSGHAIYSADGNLPGVMTMAMRMVVRVGNRLSTCHAQPAASYWRLPTCEWKG